MLDALDLGQPGTHEITYQVVMGCDGAACASTGDNIKVIINDDKPDRVEQVTNYDNIEFQKRWVSRTFRFTVSDPIISVIYPI